MKDLTFLSWGRYPNNPQSADMIYWQDEIAKILNNKSEDFSTLAYGKGRSYGDSCLAYSNRILNMENLNSFINLDFHNGLLKVESGITLLEILKIIIPKGWFLPVTPGTKYVTVGGAIANDVHGKNHHKRGTFGNHVQKIGIFRSDKGYKVLSPEDNKELFAATIGGLGLTGIIAWAEIKLIKINSSRISFFSKRFETLDDFIRLSNEFDKNYEYSVAWIDCLANRNKIGRGIYIAGNFYNDGKFVFKKASKLNIPFKPRFSILNKFLMRMFNTGYYNLAPGKIKRKITNYNSFFYPLDYINNWNQLYGKKGFQQYQVVFPDENSEIGIKEILKLLSKSKSGSYLSTLKKFGNIKSPGLLSWPIKGITLALDFPQNKLNKATFQSLNHISQRYQGKIYPAKDAQVGAKLFKESNPNWEQLEKYRDPKLLSQFWGRILK